ncbi:hypothetical protein JKP88DRAFT_143910, partial [Tribonema minus]
MAAYNVCLYHMKGIGPYLAVWDIDEYLVLGDASLAADAVVTLVERVENAQCPDWCFLTFPSQYVYARDLSVDRTGEVRLPSENICPDLQWAWEKSILRTKNVWVGGFHYGGAC